MKASSLQSKTIRPGNLNGYSFYYSGRNNGRRAASKTLVKTKHRGRLALLVLVLAVLALPIIAYARSQNPTKPITLSSNVNAPRNIPTSTSKSSPPTQAPATTPVVTPPPNNCAGNTLTQLVKVSISSRHMWACSGDSVAYDTPVVTGISYLSADLTPTGTYHIYSKQIDQSLTGHDSTGSWDDYVYYWMPFLSDKYGIYGFHDATWRSASDFGNISADSAEASHGCVEMPLAAAKWLYNWAAVGTTVSIES